MYYKYHDDIDIG